MYEILKEAAAGALTGREIALNEPIKVAIVDDDPSFRRTVRGWLDGEGDIEVIGDMQEDPLVFHWLRQIRPEVLLLNVTALSTAQIREAATLARIIVLHTAEQESLALDALRAGALGHLDKEKTRPSQAIAAVRAARRGAAFLSPAMAGRILDEVSARRQQNHERR